MPQGRPAELCPRGVCARRVHDAMTSAAVSACISLSFCSALWRRIAIATELCNKCLIVHEPAVQLGCDGDAAPHLRAAVGDADKHALYV